MDNISIDLVSVSSLKYRGIERPLTTNEILDNSSEKNVSTLLKCYFEYIDIVYNQKLNSTEMFNKLFRILEIFKQKKVLCEMILFSSNPVSEFNGTELHFLGYDIANQNGESLLTSPNTGLVLNYLNGNGLCSELSYVEMIKTSLSFELLDFQWQTYYVYNIEWSDDV